MFNVMVHNEDALRHIAVRWTAFCILALAPQALLPPASVYAWNEVLRGALSVYVRM